MRIGIIGAGALGSYFGYKLDSGGHEVLLLDRGTRAAQIAREGVRLKDALTGQVLRAKLPVLDVGAGTEEPGLSREAVGALDLLIVVLRAHQVEAALPLIKKVADPSEVEPPVLMVGSYVKGMSEWAKKLGEERVVFGFPGMSVVLERDESGVVVEFCERGEDDTEPWGVTLGRLRGKAPENSENPENPTHPKNREAAYQLLRGSGIPVHAAGVMEAVFLSQALVRLPMIAALQLAGGTLDQLAARRDLLRLMIKAIREGMGAVKKTGLRPVPDTLEMYRWVPIFISVNMIKNRFDTIPSKIGIEKFAERAGEELQLLERQFLELVAGSTVEAEHLEQLLGGFQEDE
ncbi:MAG: 2-dehydropantoate 2-reductase N-terminal domain-containing protein [Spirochaetia bacterium]|nr:2-dehydropantoate 2-reductase N-terminal domain-containing protein [Spirochaetia bacterium]